MRKNLLVFSLTVVLLQSCFKKKEEKVTIQTKTETKTFDSIQESKTIVKDIQYSVQVETIDSVQFHAAQLKSAYPQEKFEKIEDFTEAKKLLKGVVEFAGKDEDGESQAVKKIRFRNGTVFQDENDFDGSFFVAYFPKEDILLCEGGHTTDMSFNLKNGQKTEDTGNPDLIVTSPGKEFRLNGSFGGQKCFFYFIQKKIGNEYVKVIQLDKEFERLTGIWLCIIGKSFWADEKTLYLTEESNYTDAGLKKRYFRIKLTEQ
ncbi:MAG: hypothetical protein LBE92_02610 [Chryseobacterium sp.]|jgi:hypothetical protein|uniref:hypothetical protein n=1 Tax=Chryseobacterium sp. TaxID=1871047 RepID=UPI002823E799|nr:hypothetical protein [Chryseobacterium sp.]MDR2234991.1 hypothetical protein [Chryseobacterium sp.]